MRSNEDEQRFRKAIKDGNVVTIEVMIAAGFDVNLPISSARLTPLHWAVDDRASIEVFKCLIAAGANVNGSSQSNNLPLHWAVRCSLNSDCFKFLLDSGANPKAQTLTGETPLHLVWQSERLSMVEELVAAGGEINALDFDDETPLRKAVVRDRIDVCRALVANGAALTVPSLYEDDEYLTAFQKAVMANKVEAVRFFLEECGERGDQALGDGRPLLDIAEPEVAELLRSWVTADQVLAGVRGEHGSPALQGGADAAARPGKKAGGLGL